jgi:hypothetical protein
MKNVGARASTCNCTPCGKQNYNAQQHSASFFSNRTSKKVAKNTLPSTRAAAAARFASLPLGNGAAFRLCAASEIRHV